MHHIDKPESKSQVQAQSQIEKRKRNLDSGLSGLSLKSHGPPTPPHPQKIGGQQEGRGQHRWVQHAQWEHYQRNVLRVFVKGSGQVGIGMPSKKKKPEDLRTLPQLRHWDIFLRQLPLPPLLHLGQYSFEILVDPPPILQQKGFKKLLCSCDG